MTARTSITNRSLLVALLAALSFGSLASPAFGQLVYTKRWWTPHSAIWVARDDGSAARQLVAGRLPWVVSGPAAISPDGRVVVYSMSKLAGQGGFRLMAVAAAGGRPRVLAPETFFAAWSPDSRTIAATRSIGFDHEQLVTIDVNGGAVRTLATVPQLGRVAFSPAGDALVYAAGSGLASDLYTVPVGGGSSTRLTRNGHSGSPAWGRRWIAFSRWYPTMRVGKPSRKVDLYLIAPTGGRVHRITHLHVRGISPTAWPVGGHRLLAEIASRKPPSATHATATDWAATVRIPLNTLREIGKPSKANGPFGVVGVAISRDGTTVLGTLRVRDTMGGIDVVTLPFHGGRPRVLARHALDPSWSR